MQKLAGAVFIFLSDHRVYLQKRLFSQRPQTFTYIHNKKRGSMLCMQKKKEKQSFEKLFRHVEHLLEMYYIIFADRQAKILAIDVCERAPRQDLGQSITAKQTIFLTEMLFDPGGTRLEKVCFELPIVSVNKNLRNKKQLTICFEIYT